MNTEVVRPAARPMAVMAVLCLGLFMTLLDLTIVNIAIPSLTAGIGASLDQVLWVLNAYSLVFAVLLITSGRLGDIFGPRNLFAAGLTLFTAASAASGFAQEPTQLILARAAQGLGAALMSPQSLPLITSLFPPDRRGGAFALIGAMSGLAVLAGPTLGGLIVTHWGWRWIFFVNLPVGMITLLLTFLVVPDLRPGRRHRLDLVGVVLASAGLLAIVFGLIEGQRYDWGTVLAGVTIPEIIAAGVVLIGAFLYNQARRQRGEPLLNFAIFSDRNYTLMTLVLAAMGFAVLGLFLPLAIYYQSVLGLSALDAGLATAPMPLAMMVTSGAGAGLVQRFGGKWFLVAGLTLFAAGMAYIDLKAGVGVSRWSFLPGLVLAGVGLGFTWGPVYSIATRDLQPRLAGVAAGVLTTIQELGTVVASAALGALIQNRLAESLRERAATASVQLPAAFRDGFVSAFKEAGRNGLEVGSGQTGGSLRLPPSVPAEVVQQLHVLATNVFQQAFVDAMRPTLLVPIAVILAAALAALAVRGVRASAGATAAEEIVEIPA